MYTLIAQLTKHVLQYELARSSAILENQASLFKTLAMPDRNAWSADEPIEAILARILDVSKFYQGKINATDTRSAKDTMRVVAREIESNGIHKERKEVLEPP